MASNTGGGELYESCMKHKGIFALEFYCQECKKVVCVRCLVLEHPGHKYIHLEHLNLKTEEEREKVAEFKESTLPKLEKRIEVVQEMKRGCREMSQCSHEKADRKFLSIAKESERKRQRVELETNDDDRCIDKVSKSLDIEENELYSLAQFSKEVVLQRDILNKFSLEDMQGMQEKVEQHICSKLPHIKTYSDLQDKFKRIKASGDEGEGEGEEKNTDDIVLYDLACEMQPDDFTPMGLRLGLCNNTLKKVRVDYSRSIVEAVYQVFQEWKRTLSTEVLIESHFEKLEQCLREIKDSKAADWLIERLQKSKGQNSQPGPSSSPGQGMQSSPSTSQLVQDSPSTSQLVQVSPSTSQLMQDSPSTSQLVQVSPSTSQLVQDSPSPDQTVQPSPSPGQLEQPSSSGSQ